MDCDKQGRIIRYLVQKLAKLHREDLVHEKFLKQLKDEGRVGILEDLEQIRRSPDIQKDHDHYFHSLNALISGEELPDQSLQELIQRLGLDEGKPN